MANEIEVVALLRCTNGDFVVPQLGTPFYIDQQVAGGNIPGMVNVGLSIVEVDLSDLTSPGQAWIKNVGEHGTGTGSPIVTYGPMSGVNLIPFGELREGDQALFRLTSVYTPRIGLISTEHDTKVQLSILEN